MNKFTTILLGCLICSSCADDPDPVPRVEIVADSSITQFEPKADGYLIEFRVRGGVDRLRGTATVRIGVVGDGTAAANITQNIPVDLDGGFNAPVRLVVSKTGLNEVYAEFGKEKGHKVLTVPTGKLALAYLETNGPLIEGCVDLVGQANDCLMLDGAGPETRFCFIDGTCDASGKGKFARFSIPATDAVLTISDADGGVGGVPSVAPLKIDEQATQPREVDMTSSTVLPAAGQPMLVRLQVRRGGLPLPWVGYSLSVAPSNVTVAATQVGSTDANGEVSLLLTSPIAPSAQVLFRTGRFEGVFPLAR